MMSERDSTAFRRASTVEAARGACDEAESASRQVPEGE